MANITYTIIPRPKVDWCQAFEDAGLSLASFQENALSATYSQLGSNLSNYVFRDMVSTERLMAALGIPKELLKD